MKYQQQYAIKKSITIMKRILTDEAEKGVKGQGHEIKHDKFSGVI